MCAPLVKMEMHANASNDTLHHNPPPALDVLRLDPLSPPSTSLASDTVL